MQVRSDGLVSSSTERGLSVLKKKAHELTMSRGYVSEMCNGGADMKDRQKCIISCEEG